MKAKSALIATIGTIGLASTAMADQAFTTVNFSWTSTGNTTATISLPAVQSIDSIVLTLAHTFGENFDLYVDAQLVGGLYNFDLMYLETANAGATGDFSMGVAAEDGSLGNVASYTFVPGGAPDWVAPHSPAGSYAPNAWTFGALAADDYVLIVNDNFPGNGGAIGTYTINYTLPPTPTNGACCFAGGSCTDQSQADCTAAGGTYQGDGSTCATAGICTAPPPTGACCDAGSCTEETQADCATAGGTYQGNGTSCATPGICTAPPVTGACCDLGTCTEETQADCATAGGTYQGDGTSCATPGICPPPPVTGACCVAIVCTQVTQAACATAGGTYQGDGTSCATPGICPLPQGACCLPNGSCTDGLQAACTAAGGTYQGDGTTCAGVVCILAVAQDRVSATEKGSVLIYSKVELRYTAAGALIQDTFIDIANDFPADVNVKMYFINGDPRIVVGGVVVEPGWNWVNNVIELTANEPTYWSAATGLPKGVSPFGVLDPGVLPGRPDPEVPGERMLRGFIIAFAVNAAGCEIRWNHLKGDACIVNYPQNSAWEYNAWSFAAGTVAHGQPLPGCGTLAFNGVEYAPAFDQLLMDFYAVGSAAFSTAGNLVTMNTDLTLHPLSADLRQETTGPVQTKASFDIWNMNEVKFSGTDRCIVCWNQALLSSYGLPNHFFLVNLQTDKGRARIDGLASAVVCPAISGVAPASSIDPLLGVVAKHLTFNGVAAAVAGTNLHGVGTQTDGVIQFNAAGGGGPPPENTGAMWLNAISGQINEALSPRNQR